MSNIPSAGELLQQTSNQSPQTFKLGTVDDLFPNGTAKVKFDGEETASEKQYAYLSGYAPVVNDRVLLAYCGGTYIILDKIQYNVPPDDGNAVTSGTFTTLNTSGDTVLGGSLKVSGNIAFFGGTPVAKSGVGNLQGIQTQETADATYNATEQAMLNHLKFDVNSLQISLNAVIQALKSYNLI